MIDQSDGSTEDVSSLSQDTNISTGRVSPEERERILAAAQILVNDSRNEICDEGQVDRFIRYIHRRMKPLANYNLAQDVLTYVIDCIEKQGCLLHTLNRPTLLRLGSSATWSRLLYDETDHVLEKKFVDFLISYIPFMMQTDDLAIMLAYLRALNELIDVEPGFNLIMSIRLEPALAIPEQQANISDILTFLQCYLRRAPTYHLRNEAENILRAIIKAPDNYCLLYNNYPQLTAFLRNAIEECNFNIIRQINCVIASIRKRPKRRMFLANFDLEGIFFTNIDKVIVNSTIDSNDLIDFCHCLASTLDCPREDRDKIVEKLKSHGHIRAIVKFLSFLDDTFHLASWLIYCVYPMLHIVQKNGLDIQDQVSKLLIDNKEREFIARLTDNKLITFIMGHIEIYISKTLARDIIYKKSTAKTIVFVADSILLLINSQLKSSTPMAYRCVMRCFETLNQIIKALKRSKVSHRQLSDHLLPALCDTIETIMRSENCHKNQYYPQAFKSLRELLPAALSFESRKTLDKLAPFINTEAERAIEEIDTCLLQEILEIYVDCTRHVGQALVRRDENKFCQLVWQKIWPFCRDTKDCTLIAACMQLLLVLDAETPVSTLKQLNINRYHDIPEIFATYLCDINTETVIRHAIISSFNLGDRLFEEGYVGHLDSLNLPKTCRPYLNKIIEGLCLSIRTDLSPDMQTHSLCILSRVIDIIIRNGDSNTKILARLAEHQVLDLIYEVLYSDLYNDQVQVLAKASYQQISQLVKMLGHKYTHEKIDAAMSACRNKDIRPQLALSHQRESPLRREIIGTSDDAPIDAIVNEILSATPRTDAHMSDCY